MLRLRPYKPCDAGAILTWIKNEREFRLWTADRYDHYPITAEDMNRHYDSFAGSDAFWAMTAYDESGVAGHLIMRFTDEAKKQLRFGFIIVDASRRGKGYGSKMLRMAIRYAAEFLGVEKITLGVFENNPAAYRCYRSVGFREGAEPHWHELMGEQWKCVELEYLVE